MCNLQLMSELCEGRVECCEESVGGDELRGERDEVGVERSHELCELRLLRSNEHLQTLPQRLQRHASPLRTRLRHDPQVHRKLLLHSQTQTQTDTEI